MDKITPLDCELRIIPKSMIIKNEKITMLIRNT